MVRDSCLFMPKASRKEKLLQMLTNDMLKEDMLALYEGGNAHPTLRSI